MKIFVNGHDLSAFSLCVQGGDPAVLTAAGELRHYLALGAESGEGTIFLGCAQDLPALAGRTLAEEEIYLRIDGTRVTVAGGSGRGVLYAAYEFLERFCGWRFFTPALETAPKGTVRLTDREYVYCPPFDYRMNLTPYAGEGTAHFQKRHLNAKWGSEPLPDSVGGSVVYAANNAHTFRDLLPDSVYFDEHPECFAMNEAGERRRAPNHDTQPCLTNPEVFSIVLENLRKTLREHPNARFASISQNDVPEFCHCPACARVNAEEETDGGTIYRFVNRIAAALADEFPRVTFDTLPYVYSTKPPAHETLVENVSVRLCLMDTCREHTLSDESCPYNRKMREYFRNWAGKCRNLYLWDYTANFKNYPISLPNFKLLYQNMKRFRCFPVKGMLYQGAHTTDPDIEFGALWAYLQSKLLWEPDMDYAEYLTCAKEFLHAYYGAGWTYLYDYLMLVLQQPSSDYHYGPSATCEQILPMLHRPDGRTDRTFLRDANRLFDLAERAAGAQRENVQRTRLHLIWYELCTTYRDVREHGSASEVAALREKYRVFVETVGRWPGFRLSEGAAFDAAFDFDRDPNDFIR